MKRFKFRLQKVLDYREADKREKQRELGLRNRDLHQAKEDYNSLVDAHDRVLSAQEEVFSMAQLQAVGAYQKRLVNSMEEQEQKIQEAMQMVEKAREFYFKSAIDAGALNQVLDRRKAEWTYEWKKTERKFGNEVAIQRHIRRKSNRG